MAMACLGFVTFFPLRPDFSLPCFIARISRSTSLPAEGEYLRPEDFFELDLLELDFFDAEPRVLFFALLPRVLFFAALLRELRLELLLRDLPRELLLDFFLAAFLVAITILLGGQMAGSLGRVACITARRVVGSRAQFVGVLSDDATNSRDAHEWIGDEPCCNATKRAGDDELENCRRDERMK
jgi:hypothetical protein